MDAMPAGHMEALYAPQSAQKKGREAFSNLR
jgi:hypothetical protein